MNPHLGSCPAPFAATSVTVRGDDFLICVLGELDGDENWLLVILAVVLVQNHDGRIQVLGGRLRDCGSIEADKLRLGMGFGA